MRFKCKVRIFRHLEEEEVKYFRHFSRAAKFSFFCFVCAVKSLIHGFIPDVFKDTSGELEQRIESFLSDE